jgi:adenylate cyclase class IV
VITKRKEGQSFIVHGVLVEVSRVEHLGWFVELELVLPEGAPREEIGGARDRLMELLRQLEISPSKIEPRSYNRMIHAQLSGIDGAPRSPV